MPHDMINPYIRSAAYTPWTFSNIYSSISYHMRFFAIRNHEAFVKIRDEETAVTPDTLLILKPGIPYDFRNAGNTRFDLYSCNFDLTQAFRDTMPCLNPVHEPDYLPERTLHTSDVIGDLADAILLQNCPDLCQQVQRIYELFISKKPHSEEIISGIIKSVFYEALQLSEAQRDSAAMTLHGAEIARRTMQYIREHCTEPINEQTVAAVMNYHPYYLSRLTQQHYGVTPYRYLMQCRLELSVHLLTSSDRSIGEIAAVCGFSSLSHFSAFIRREMGMPPNALRRNGRNGSGGAL